MDLLRQVGNRRVLEGSKELLIERVVRLVRAPNLTRDLLKITDERVPSIIKISDRVTQGGVTNSEVLLIRSALMSSRQVVDQFLASLCKCSAAIIKRQVTLVRIACVA